MLSTNQWLGIECDRLHTLPSGNGIKLHMARIAGSGGQLQAYKQRFEFASVYGSANQDAVMFEPDRNTETLIDPINHTPRFQVSMFEASPYSRTDMGLWSTIG